MAFNGKKNRTVTGSWIGSQIANSDSLSEIFEDKKRIREEIALLAPGLQIALKERYGLEGEDPKSSQEMATEYHCSEGDIQEICDYAIRALIYKKRQIKNLV